MRHDLNETIRVHRSQSSPVLQRISDPYYCDPTPAPDDIREYLRHTNAQFAIDASKPRSPRE